MKYMKYRSDEALWDWESFEYLHLGYLSIPYFDDLPDHTHFAENDIISVFPEMIYYCKHRDGWSILSF